MSSAVIQVRLEVDDTNYFCPAYQNTGIQITKKVGQFDELSSQGSITKIPFRARADKELFQAIGNIDDLREESKVDLNLSIDGGILVNGVEKFTGQFQVLRVFRNYPAISGEVELLFLDAASGLKSRMEKILVKDLMLDNDGNQIEFFGLSQVGKTTNWQVDARAMKDDTGFGFILLEAGQKWKANRNLPQEGLPFEWATSKDFWLTVYLEKVFERLSFLEGIDISFDASISNYIDWQSILCRNTELSQPTFDRGIVKDAYMERVGNNTPVSLVFLANAEQSYRTGWTAVTQGQIIFNTARNSATLPVEGTYSWNIKTELDILLTATNSSVAWLSAELWFVDYNTTNKRYFVARKGNAELRNVNDTATIFFDVPFETYMEPGEYQLTIFLSGISVSSDFTIDINSSANSRWTLLQGPDGTGLTTYSPLKNLPEELNVWDVLKSVIYQVNGVIRKLDINSYEVTPWVNYIDDTKLEQLGGKIENNSEIVIEPFSTIGAKNIKLKWAEDEDIYNQKFQGYTGITYGEYFKRSTVTDFATKEVEVELPFSASVLAPVATEDIWLLHLVNEEGNGIKTKPKMFMYYIDAGAGLGAQGLKNYRGEAIYTFPQSGGGSSAYRILFPAGHYLYHNALEAGVVNENITTEFLAGNTFFSNQNYPFFGDLFNLFWRDYLNQTYTEKSRRVKMNIEWDQFEFEEMDFKTTYQLENVNYRLLEIPNYPLSQKTPVQCTFAKLIDIERIDIAPFYPYRFAGFNGTVVEWRDSSDGSALGKSPGPAADLEASCIAYGIIYDRATELAAIYPNGVGLVVGVLLK